ncbi:MAG: AtpZ/AtpI family protein, partial [Clostridiales bacterium]|nr:AtpZ/AtpI family protein [Clostridiales bacterium]
SQLGLSMCACVLIGVLAGSWLDRWLGTKPWLLLLCSLIGAAAAFKVMYDLAVRGWSKRK